MSESSARGTINGAYPAMKMRELQVEILRGEVRNHLEHAEPYGWSSEPETDSSAEAFIIFFGGDRSHGVVICAANRRWRPTDLKAGDVTVYDKRGHEIRLEEGRIHVTSPDDLVADVTGNVMLTVKGNVTATVKGTLSADITGTANLKSAASVTIEAPLTTIKGNAIVTGGLNVQGTGATGAAMQCTGNIDLKGGMTSTEDITAGGVSLISHTHGGVETGGGNTGVPN